MVLINKTDEIRYHDSYERNSGTEMSVSLSTANTPAGENVVIFEIDVPDIYLASIGLSLADAISLKTNLEKMIETAK